MRVVYVLPALMLLVAKAEPRLEFEAATIRPAVLPKGPVPRGGPGTNDPGRMRYSYMSVKNLLMTAYGMKNYQISGPAWIESQVYDIEARVPAGATKEQAAVMLQNLLADRFQLKLHRETKEVPIYNLVAGKKGSKLQPYEEGKPFAFHLPDEPEIRPGQLMMTMNAGKRRVEARKQSVQSLADMLAAEAGRPVLNKTGMNGDIDYALEFQPSGQNRAPAAPPPDVLVTGAAHDDDSPSIFTAVQEQLGLRLEPGKGPIETLIVDSGEKVPTEN